MTEQLQPVRAASPRSELEPLCATEPVHLPGTIQPQGALVAFRADDLRIVHISENLPRFLGQRHAVELGASAAPLLTGPLEAALRGLGSAGEAPVTLPVPYAPGVVAHLHAMPDEPRLVVIEFEWEEPDRFGLGEARSLLRSLRGVRSVDAVSSLAARELRGLTGYDRVMVYRFDEEGHGEVIAEEMAPGQDSYLGLRYPAIDIPLPVRRLFLTQRVRGIADAAADPVRLLSLPGVPPLDMTWCAHRGVAAVHREYLHNMGVRASLVLSLLCGGRLWGLLVCHHRRPKTVDASVRSICELVAQVVALQIDTAEQFELGQAMGRRADGIRRITDLLLTAQLSGQDPVVRLQEVASDVLDLAGATGAILRLRGQTVSCGAVPPPDVCNRLLTELRYGRLAGLAAPDGTFVSDGVTSLLPELKPDLGSATGVLAIPISRAAGDVLVWLRPEQARTVRWGGDPRKGTPDAEGRLSPRKSFAAWSEEVRDRSTPWSAADRTAALELRRAVEATLLHATEAELVRLRGTDAVTGLATRSALLDTLSEWTAAPSGSLASLAMVRLDLDRFGSVNELLGPAGGDQLLAEVAGRIAANAERPAQKVARIGADEFAILWRGASEAEVAELGQVLRAALRAPFAMPGRPLRVTASIGLAWSAADPHEAEEGQPTRAERLLAASEVALRKARREGGDRIERLDDPRLDEVARRIEIEQGLRQALNEDGNGLVLNFQPVFALDEGRPRLRGFEALLRWRHATLGQVSPGEFIPVAEETGLIGAIGDWVLEAALRQLAAWRATYPARAIEMAVNVSPLQVSRGDFAERLAGRLEEAGVPPTALLLEVTEGALADATALASLAQIRQLGCKVSIDDFGTGFSSLSYLRRIPADEVKLDRTFLSGDGSPQSRVQHEEFLAALIALARAAGLSVLAEGVETQAQLAALSAVGCDAAQGFMLGRPMPAQQAALLLVEEGGQQLRRQPKRLPFSFRDIVESTDDVVVVTDNQIDKPGPHIVYVNAAFTRLTGYSLEEVLGRSPRMLQGPGTSAAALEKIRAGLQTGSELRTRVLNYSKTGLPYWLDIRIVPLRDATGRITHYAAIERDVTKDTTRLDELEKLAHNDTLTGVANRRGLTRFAEQAFASHRGSDPVTGRKQSGPRSEICVIYLDIDHFKSLNDTHGHPIGDAVLFGMAEILRDSVRRSDMIARTGGEEFVVCMPGCSIAQAALTAERLRITLGSTPIQTPAGPLSITCSLGVAMVDAEETTIEPALTRADEALYRAKQAGRDRVELAAQV